MLTKLKVHCVKKLTKELPLNTQDFVTVDGGEGGTGAAPPEFSMNVGMPLIEALALVDNVLIGVRKSR